MTSPAAAGSSPVKQVDEEHGASNGGDSNAAVTGPEMTHQSGAKGTMGAAPPFNDQPASRRRLDQRGQDITSNADAAAYTPAPANGVVAAISDTAATAAIDSNAAKLGGAKAQSDPGDARAKSETEAAGSRDVLVEQECAKSPRLEAGGAHQKNENSPPPTSPRPGSSGSTKRPKASVPQPYEVRICFSLRWSQSSLRCDRCFSK